MSDEFHHEQVFKDVSFDFRGGRQFKTFTNCVFVNCALTADSETMFLTFKNCTFVECVLSGFEDSEWLYVSANMFEECTLVNYGLVGRRNYYQRCDFKSNAEVG